MLFVFSAVELLADAVRRLAPRHANAEGLGRPAVRTSVRDHFPLGQVGRIDRPAGEVTRKRSSGQVKDRVAFLRRPRAARLVGPRGVAEEDAPVVAFADERHEAAGLACAAEDLWPSPALEQIGN